MSFKSTLNLPIQHSFQQSSGSVTNTQAKKPTPFSLRLSTAERIQLEQLADGKPLGAYIRDRLLGDKAQKRQTLRKPQVNEQQIAAVMAMLGGSRMPSNLNQLAKHANMGTLDVSRDVELELQDACKAVYAMRDALLIALGMRPVDQQKNYQ